MRATSFSPTVEEKAIPSRSSRGSVASVQSSSLCDGDSEDDEMDWYSDDENLRGEELHAGKPRNTLDGMFAPDFVTQSASVMWWHDDRKSITGTEEEYATANVVHMNQEADSYVMSMAVSSAFVGAQGFDGRPDELSKRPATTRDIGVECEAKDLDNPTSEEPSTVTTGGSNNEIPPEIVVNGLDCASEPPAADRERATPSVSRRSSVGSTTPGRIGATSFSPTVEERAIPSRSSRGSVAS